MRKRKEAKGGIGHWLSDRFLRGIIALLRALPYERRVPLMGWLMRRVIGPIAGYDRRAITNLALIHPDMPLTEQRGIADSVLDNMGRTLIENYSNRDLASRMAGHAISGPGIDALNEARAQGRPVIFVTAHFGNYEAPRHALTAMGYSIGGIYRAMNNPFFNEHYVRTMTEVSGPVFEKGRGTMGFARHLKSGGMATILFDVRDKSGETIDFLGVPAATTLSPATLAVKFNAALIPYFGIRRADGLNFDIVIEEPIPHGDPVSMMREATARLEAQIAAHPGQWFWVHRRWKGSQQHAAGTLGNPPPRT